MTTLTNLRERRTSYAVLLMKLIKDVEKFPNAAFFMMEGKDADYYRPRVGTIVASCPIPTFYRNCSGKINLKNLLHAVQSNDSVNSAHVLFFFRPRL